jgi:hypothetical protein
MYDWKGPSGLQRTEFALPDAGVVAEEFAVARGPMLMDVAKISTTQSVMDS